MPPAQPHTRALPGRTLLTRQVELIGILFGLFELTFVATMLMSRPSLKALLKGLVTVHTEPAYFKLVAANIGAVIMPWMIYFQQSAIVAKKLRSPTQACA